MAAAAEAGQLRWWQTRRVVDAAWALPEVFTPALDARVAELAGQGRLGSRFSPQLGRLVMALDPDLADRTLIQALADREVRVRPDQDTPGKGVLIASLPAEGAITVAACLDRLADTPLSTPPTGLSAAGRSADARRADALVGLTACVLDALADTGPAADGTAAGELDATISARIATAVRAAVGAGAPDTAAPVTADPATPAAPADLAPPVTPAPVDVAGRRTRRVQRRSGEVRVTMSVETLLGLRDDPGDLAGWGPITAGHARRLATADGTVWQRILTDPFHGSVLDVGRTRYTPTAAIRAHVLARDGYRCQRPGCSNAAADLDHIRAFDDGGPTAVSNLQAVCRGCHTVKHQGWTLRRDRSGLTIWRTPHGLDTSQPLPDLRPEDRMPKPPLPPSTWRSDLEQDLRRAAQQWRALARGNAGPQPPADPGNGDSDTAGPGTSTESDTDNPPF